MNSNEKKIQQFIELIQEKERAKQKEADKAREKLLEEAQELIKKDLGEWILEWGVRAHRNFDGTLSVDLSLEWYPYSAHLTAREVRGSQIWYSFAITDERHEIAHEMFKDFSAENFSEDQVLEAIAYCLASMPESAKKIFWEGLEDDA